MEYAKHKPEFVSLDEQELFGSLRKMKMALKK